MESSQSQITLIKKQKIKPGYQIRQPSTTLLKILQWRKVNQAPVDVVGCERLFDKNAPIQIQKYQILISLMLSIQTKDQTTSKVVQRLKQIGLQPKNIASIKLEKLQQLIRQANFHKRKAKNIKEVSQIILNNGIPKNTQQIMKFPGIGVKIALIYMKVAQGKVEGIGVDTHVHRISNRLGWVKTNTPNETEQQLKNLFHRKYWSDMNIGLVGFGQILCNAKKPECSKCPVKQQCPSSLDLF